MEKYTYTCNYPNDTEFEFDNCKIKMRYKQEDFTEEIEYAGIGQNMKGLAYDLLSEITEFLDVTVDGIYRSEENIALAINGLYWDDYSNSALIAFEHMLHEIITKEEKKMTKPDTTTYEGVQQFFEQCKAFWMRQGDTAGVATSKAFWWDCVECFNFDKSWNDAKRKFAKDFRNYNPGDPVPDEKLVGKGAV